MHKHRQGLYGSHSRVDMNHNARGWPQKNARSQLSMQKAMQGDKSSWEAGTGGVGCRAVDGWTREKGASRCLKPLTAAKTADPRTGTDSEELRRGLHWSQKASQQARPKESFMGPGEQKMQERYFCPHTVQEENFSSHFLQDTALWQFLKCTIPTVDFYRFVAEWKGESWKLTAWWNCLGVPTWFIPSSMVTITQQQHEPCQSCWIIQ